MASAFGSAKPSSVVLILKCRKHHATYRILNTKDQVK